MPSEGAPFLPAFGRSGDFDFGFDLSFQGARRLPRRACPDAKAEGTYPFCRRRNSYLQQHGSALRSLLA